MRPFTDEARDSCEPPVKGDKSRQTASSNPVESKGNTMH